MSPWMISRIQRLGIKWTFWRECFWQTMLMVCNQNVTSSYRLNVTKRTQTKTSWMRITSSSSLKIVMMGTNVLFWKKDIHVGILWYYHLINKVTKMVKTTSQSIATTSQAECALKCSIPSMATLKDSHYINIGDSASMMSRPYRPVNKISNLRTKVLFY